MKEIIIFFRFFFFFAKSVCLFCNPAAWIVLPAHSRCHRPLRRRFALSLFRSFDCLCICVWVPLKWTHSTFLSPLWSFTVICIVRCPCALRTSQLQLPVHWEKNIMPLRQSCKIKVFNLFAWQFFDWLVATDLLKFKKLTKVIKKISRKMRYLNFALLVWPFLCVPFGVAFM